MGKWGYGCLTLVNPNTWGFWDTKRQRGLHSKAFPKDGGGAALQARAGQLSTRASEYGDGKVAAFCGWLGVCFYGSSV